MTKSFVAAIEHFAEGHHIPLIQFDKGQRKEKVMAEQVRHFDQKEGVVFLRKAQKKSPVYRTEKRRNPQTGQRYPWIIRSTAMVNQYYWYCVDRDFGSFFLKFCSYFPYAAKRKFQNAIHAGAASYPVDLYIEGVRVGVDIRVLTDHLHGAVQVVVEKFAKRGQFELRTSRNAHDSRLGIEM